MSESIEKFEIRNRYTDAVQVTAEITCSPDATFSFELGLAIRWAVKSGANLSRADLSWADLSWADLSGANLSRTDLSGADLSEADLSGANLSWADLSGANLSGANLSRTDLSGADLSESALRPFKADLFLTLSELRAGPLEAIHLVQKLRAGEVDGSTYGDHGGNKCACLVGTIGGARGVSGDELDHDSTRPAERWFMMIKVGDKAGLTGEDGKETGGGYAARMALEWALDWCASMCIDPDAPPPALDALPLPEAA